MSSETTACPVCARVEIRHVLAREGLVALMKDEYRVGWLLDPCAACGMAIGVHQIYLHPHRSMSAQRRCAGFQSE